MDKFNIVKKLYVYYQSKKVNKLFGGRKIRLAICQIMLELHAFMI
jgi:ATPase subunit of ABC transporter with duplicated ATPase domains